MTIMTYDIRFTDIAAGHVRSYRKFEQRVILDAIQDQLACEPATETRNRKRLGQNELSDWELRVEEFRVFYDIVVEESQQIVKIKAVGHKEHNRLFIGHKEVQL
jgi:mRNA-degrading endonuclease RelE of RelBE toxin-antitoxin system